jgi:hypothetical protein
MATALIERGSPVLGSVAQVIALTAHGNASLRNQQTGGAEAFFPSNSTFQFCESVLFTDVARYAGSSQEAAWATDPIAWFDRLKQERTSALRLHYGAVGGRSVGTDDVPERMLAGFVGGAGRWLIEAMGPGGSDYWEGRWQIGDRSRSDRRIWRVTYGRIARNQVTPGADRDDLEDLKRRLEKTLLEIQNYANAHRLASFAALFEKSRLELSAEAPGKDVYHTDLTPNGQLSLTAQQLLGASQLGWVFGGNGIVERHATRAGRQRVRAAFTGALHSAESNLCRRRQHNRV